MKKKTIKLSDNSVMDFEYTEKFENLLVEEFSLENSGSLTDDHFCVFLEKALKDKIAVEA